MSESLRPHGLQHPVYAVSVNPEMATPSEVSQTGLVPHAVRSLRAAQMNQAENRSVVAKGLRRLGEGWPGRSGLADANYYIQDGLTTRFFCRAQGTVSNSLR